jgi:hypothetical protein
MSSSNFAVDLSALDIVQRHPIGLEYEEPTGFIDLSAPAGSRNAASRGKRVWIYVQFAVGTITAGLAIARALGTATLTGCVAAPTSSLPSRIVGVAQGVLGDAVVVSYGWILREGVGLGQCDATGVIVDRPLVIDASTAGCMITSAGTTTATADGAIGWCLSTQAVAGTFAAQFNCRG